jgi:ERCC4-type nuclease
MILIDPRDGNLKEIQASIECMRIISKLGIPCERSRLVSGDFCFEGHGPDGRILIGVERKSLHDLLHCIDDGRYNQQRISMKQTYGFSFLIVEGLYKPSEDGWLLQGFVRKDGSISWRHCDYRQRPVLYSKLRYLLSVALSGVIITYTKNLFETAYQVCELFHYFEEKWYNHTSLLATQKLAIPSIDREPPLVRKWAADIDGIGIKRSAEAQHLFRTPYKLANSDESDWLRLSGIGVPTAQDIIRQIHGNSRRK